MGRGDDRALEELLHRPLFRLRNGFRGRLVEALDDLRTSEQAREWSRHSPLALEQAYDLTLDKFTNLGRGKDLPDSGDNHSASPGPNARLYFRAYLKYVRGRITSTRPKNELATEQVAAVTLRSFVYRQFLLSCLECRRREAGFLKRYSWNVNGSVLWLWFPASMGGRECRRWLEAHVENAAPCRPLERERVQAIIDARLIIPRFVPWEEHTDSRTARQQACSLRRSLKEVSVRGLASIVATEKAENISLQRPAIQRLGQERLKELIQRIFDALSADDHVDSRLAMEFGLSKATFSRFAGSRWHRRANRRAVPDLFLNTAHVLAGVPAFADTARQAGVWDQVEAILSRTEETEANCGE